MVINLFGTWVNPDLITHLTENPGWPAIEDQQSEQPPYTWVGIGHDGFKVEKTAAEIAKEINNDKK